MLRFFQSRTAHPRRSFAVVAFVCLALLAVLAVAQVAHVHPATSDSDHCPICIVLHSAAPVAVAACLVTLVQVAQAAPVYAPRPIARRWHPQLFVRPPPVARMGW